MIETFIANEFDAERQMNKVLLLDENQIYEAIKSIRFRCKKKSDEKSRTIAVAEEAINCKKTLLGNMKLFNELIEKFTRK